MDKSWLLLVTYISAAGVLLVVALMLVNRSVAGQDQDESNPKMVLGNLPGKLIWPFAVVFLIAVGLVNFYPFQNEAEAARVREYIEQNEPNVYVREVDTSGMTVDLEYSSGCVYTFQYILSRGNDPAIVAGTETLIDAVPVITKAGLAVMVTMEDCPKTIYALPGSKGKPSTTTTSTYVAPGGAAPL